MAATPQPRTSWVLYLGYEWGRRSCDDSPPGQPNSFGTRYALSTLRLPLDALLTTQMAGRYASLAYWACTSRFHTFTIEGDLMKVALFGSPPWKLLFVRLIIEANSQPAVPNMSAAAARDFRKELLAVTGCIGAGTFRGRP